MIWIILLIALSLFCTVGMDIIENLKDKHFYRKRKEELKKEKDISVREMIDLIDDLIKKHGKINVLTTLKSIIDFFEENV